MICYNKEDIEELKKGKEQYYVPNALFDTMQYKMIRLEVKWGYVACLNILLASPLYNKEGQAYLKDDHPQIVELLKTLAHKDVDAEKIEGYLVELENGDLIERTGRDIYLKKICNVF